MNDRAVGTPTASGGEAINPHDGCVVINATGGVIAGDVGISPSAPAL
jgi:hypothetical protein